MHEDLIYYINSQLSTPLSEDEITRIKEAFVPKKLRKHQYFLQEGDICKMAGFIKKGAMRQYTVDESGKENILGLYIENWWVADRESFAQNTPSLFSIDAFEYTELLVITQEAFQRLLKGLRFMNELATVLTERQALQLLKRVHITKTLTAEQRLADLEKTYPAFLQRFPQHIIASYLGMTKETMSRIRANKK